MKEQKADKVGRKCLVSVCLITYNHVRYLAQALDGILSQRTRHRIEVLVGDDASTDGTSEVLAEYAKRYPDVIKPFQRPRNLGMMRNFVDLYERCSGDYICPLEGDDRWCSPDKIELQVEFMEGHPCCSVCFHDTRVFHESGDSPPQRLPGPRFPRMRSIGDVVKGNFVQTPSVMYRGGLVPILPTWYASLGLGDWTLLLLHAARGYVAYIPKVMAEYRIHSGGVWSQQVPAYRMERWVSACRQMNLVFRNRFAMEFGIQMVYHHSRLAFGMESVAWRHHGRSICIGRLRSSSPRHFLAYYYAWIVEFLRRSAFIMSLRMKVKRFINRTD